MHLNRHALRAIRERSGLSLSGLARLAGVSQPHLSNLEHGHRQASPATVRRLARALKVPVPAILVDPDPDAEPAPGSSATASSADDVAPSPPDDGARPGAVDLAGPSTAAAVPVPPDGGAVRRLVAVGDPRRTPRRPNPGTAPVPSCERSEQPCT